MNRELAKKLNRELQLQLLSRSANITLADLLRFKMYTLESEYRPLKDNSIFGTLQVAVNSRLTKEVHLEIFKDHVEIDLTLLIGRLRKEGFICSIEDILNSKVITEQHIGKSYRLNAVATFALVVEIQDDCKHVQTLS